MTHWIKIMKLRDGALPPCRASEHAAGADLYACFDGDVLLVGAHKTVMVPTGLAMEIPDGYFGAIFARSGLASKKGLRPANCVGVVDSDYRGEVIVALHNDSDIPRGILPGERIAQMVILPYENAIYVESDSLSDTERGSGGFGSTGTH